MDGRSKNPILIVGGPGSRDAYVERFKGYDKYLCGSCRQLRMGLRDVRSTVCGNCGSHDIDVETDMGSVRLEEKRVAGDPELLVKLQAAVEAQRAGEKKR